MDDKNHVDGNASTAVFLKECRKRIRSRFIALHFTVGQVGTTGASQSCQSRASICYADTLFALFFQRPGIGSYDNFILNDSSYVSNVLLSVTADQSFCKLS